MSKTRIVDARMEANIQRIRQQQKLYTLLNKVGDTEQT